MRAGADLAARLISVLSQPFDLAGRKVHISGSIGIAICPNDAVDLGQLYKKADLALYRAKDEGKGRLHYFTEHLDALTHQKSRDFTELRRSMERNDFRVEYQPKVAFADGRTVGVEALLRCSNSAFIGYSTERLISIAIEAGLIMTARLMGSSRTTH